MKRFAVTKQETKCGMTYRIRTLGFINSKGLCGGLNNTERVTRWVDSDLSKEALTNLLKISLEKKVQHYLFEKEA